MTSKGHFDSQAWDTNLQVSTLAGYMLSATTSCILPNTGLCTRRPRSKQPQAATLCRQPKTCLAS